MKTRFFFSLAAAAVICFGGESLNAQNPGQFAPVYGYQVPGSTMPGSPVTSAGFAQPSPFGAPAAFISASPAMAPSQVIPVGYQDDCGGKGCGGCEDCSKGGKGNCGDCHAWEFYGDFLYLKARDAEVAYAVPFNGAVVPPQNAPRVQVGPVGVLDMDYQPAFRVGAAKIIDDCTRISFEYMRYNAVTTDQTLRGANPAYVVHSLVSHPGTASAANDYDQADGRYNILLNTADVDVRRWFYNDCDLQMGWVLGVRAAQQQQQMQVNFTGNGTENVATDIDFTGIGVKFGLAGQARLAGQWQAYGKFNGSIVPGMFSADFDQTRNLVSEVDTGWEAGRIVTIWDLELGVSRVSRCGNYRMSAGYMFMAWTNTVQTDQWVQGVHTNNFVDMGSTMTFDGLVARVEARY